MSARPAQAARWRSQPRGRVDRAEGVMENLPKKQEARPDTADAIELRKVLVSSLAEALATREAPAGILFLIDADRSRLRAAVIQGSVPFLFGMPDVISVDADHASARAWRTGAFTVASAPAPRPGSEEAFRLIPFPYSAASVPLVAEDGTRFGALTLVRPLMQGPAWAFDADERDVLSGVASRLSAELAVLSARGVTVAPGPSAILVPSPGDQGGHDVSRWGAPGAPESAGLSLMYHVHHLSTRLTQLTSLDEILPAARAHMMVPFGASGIMMGHVKDDRLWIVGSSGVSAALIRGMHATNLTPGSPWADAVLAHFPYFFDSPSGLQSHYPDVYEADDTVRSWAFLPLGVGSRHVGVCCLTFDDERVLTTEERAALMMLADLLASAVERARLSAYEHTLAESLQRTLLPRSLTALPGVITTARYVPARGEAGLGGDWYDVLQLPDGRVALIVGDVEGHSTDSAIVMGQLRSAVMAYAREGHDPAAVLNRTGRLLSELDTELIATCCIAFLSLSDGVVEVARAGHPAPLLRRPDGQLHHLDTVVGVPLGVGESAVTNTSTIVPPGSTLMLYTDGMYAAKTGELSPSVLKLLTEADGDLEELADQLTEAAADGHDDLSLLLARFEGGVAGASRRIERFEIPRHDLAGVAAARRFVRGCLRRWDAAELTDTLEVIASEAVTNALTHADSAVDIRMREYEDHIRLEVRDSDAHPPLPSAMSVTDEAEQSQAEHGRGLQIVDSLATTWGSSPHGRGKTVWMELQNPRKEADREDGKDTGSGPP
ncbi:SpoIIE family protein phosphatase [Streptomyces adustus]|uniref:SpoIIE family protein phosphatase n=1 Tax=Streptomyces adustus TaxID=1609272 RepID=A0A5N8V4Z2_9ACTN|nr:ATP-binding SpoIIE family protein phosphatase [Streptomyces adustus]MPY30169.1 SpoIIE family protein phosphatase [Streptomyces adustus]